MRVVVKGNTTGFTTRSLKCVVARAFDRVGVTGDVSVWFNGKKRGRGRVRALVGEVIQMPGDRTGRAKVDQPDRIWFGIGPMMDAELLCSWARWAGYGMRGVIGAERRRMYPASPADKEYLASRPLVPKAARRRRTDTLVDRELRKKERALARVALALRKAQKRASRTRIAIKKLTAKHARFAKALDHLRDTFGKTLPGQLAAARRATE